MGHVGSKTRSLGQLLEKHLYTVDDTVLIQSSWNFVRMFILMGSRPELKKVMSGQKQGH